MEHAADISTTLCIRGITPTEYISTDQTILPPNSRRSTLVPISLLPTEIFCEIFTLAKAQTSNSQKRGGDMSWITFSQVSTQRRQIALSLPTLWNRPPMHNNYWRSEMLKRSKGVGLTIKYSFEAVNNRYRYDSKELRSWRAMFIRVFKEHGTRIQHLSLTSVGWQFQAILDNLPVSTPQLETLVISGNHSSMFGNVDSRLVPDRAFSDSIHIRSLELSGLTMQWNTLNLANVLRLTLRNLEKNANITMERFLHFLETTTRLEYLELDDGSFHAASPTANADGFTAGKVKLSNLRELMIRATSSGLIGDFLPRLDLPESAAIKLDIRSKGRYQSIFIRLLSQMSGIFSGRVFRTLALLPDCLIKLYTGPLEDLSALDSPKANISLRISCDNVDIHDFFRHSSKLLHKITNVLFKDSLQEMGTLRETVGLLPAVSFIAPISYTGKNTSTFLDAFLIRSDSTLNGNGHPTHFSKVVTIRMVGFVAPTPNGANTDMEKLIQCITQRYRCGSPIRNIILKDWYGLRDHHIAQLRDLGVNVEWDGIEKGISTQLG